uniref:Taste receptor type 2 n=1 Tax=Leptobrachium leishanense TaxID=445787 RepID=A0A8C5M3T1_9ANUR
METESKTLTIFQVAVTVAGLSGNAYIIALCFKVWGTTGHLSPKEKLDFSLSSVNLCLQILLLSYNLCYFYWIGVSNVEILSKLFLLSGLILISSSLWISTWLSVYCNIKILNSQHRIHQLMKRHMSKMVTWLIVGSLILATAQNNLTHLMVSCKSNCFMYGMWIYLAVSSMAFALFFIANVSILHSLWRHVRNMKENINSHSNKLFTAAKTFTLLLLLCVIFYQAQLQLFTNVNSNRNESYMIYLFLISVFPALNAAILIMGNQKLKQPVLDIFKCFR